MWAMKMHVMHDPCTQKNLVKLQYHRYLVFKNCRIVENEISVTFCSCLVLPIQNIINRSSYQLNSKNFIMVQFCYLRLHLVIETVSCRL